MAKVGYTQTDRALRLDSPLGSDVLLLRGFSGAESISQLFRYHLDLLSEEESIDLESLAGKSVTVHLQKLDGEVHFNGYISRVSQGAHDGRVTHYRAEMVPWLWFLTRTADCRIFQNKTVPDIIQRIFKDLNFNDFALRLHGSFRTWEYCVQYRETDFNFVSRLMEEEGIYYFFEQAPDGSKHTLVLANSDAAHKPCPGQAKARCEFSTGGTSVEDVITDWQLEHELRPSAWAHTDYNFQTPSTNLMVNLQEKAGYEIYDFPGSYDKRGDGDTLAKARLQETRAFQDRAAGASMCRCFGAGYTVDVQDHYRRDVNQKWLLTSIKHQASMGTAYTSGGDEGDFHYDNHFEAIPASVPFRAPRTTPKPAVQGCQSAVVVGPAGEEIYTDKYGRVKVQFHWDREGKRDENSSCWVRVSYPWAGKSWGGIHIPRIGQEVLVDFLEGDPDQPIIIGRVYHAENMPPWALPGKAVVSGIKSDSTKGGGGYNEFSMDDTKGNELIQVHAQFDQDIKVLHDERTNVGRNRTESVGNDETITIGHDRMEKVVNNETITIGVNRTEDVGANETITIGANRTEKVGANETIAIMANRTETVSQNETVTISLLRTHTIGVNDMLNVGAAQEITVGAAQALTVGGAQTLTVGALQAITVGAKQNVAIASDQSTSIGGKQEIQVASDLSETVGGNQTVNVGAKLTEAIASDEERSVGGKRKTSISSDDALDVGTSLKITAGNDITLQTGAAKIVLKKDGTIEISGTQISIKGSAKVQVEGAMINVEASGVNTISGSLVKIN